MKLFLIGGFLGSGKTTAISTACQMLLKEKVAVAVISNDQGSQLVDAAFTRSLNIPNSEVRNGCFCCNYDQFYSAIEDLKASAHPDIVFAEAVGSCSDLVATIVKPVLRFAPSIEISLSVFADGPVLLSSLEGRSSFINEDIQYIYKKQLDEAEILVVNKSDVLSEKEINKIRLTLSAEYPDKKLLFQDSRNEIAIKKWLNTLNEKTNEKATQSLNIDYERYAQGEAALAWLDGSLVIHSKRKAIQMCFEFINSMFDKISFQRLPVGHLKFFLESRDWKQKISYTSNEEKNKNSWNTNVVADRATLLVNARVEASSEQLREIFFRAIKKIERDDTYVELLNVACFQPAYPKPTYKLP